VFTFLVTVKKIYDDEEVRLVLADYGGKCLWVRWVLSLEWNPECLTHGESDDEKVKDELESVTSSGDW